ncbi:Uncharacterized protein DBV15_06511 [Temnothorax longispinosus]|uniref:Uncharacterized protein n=1 Tax=Temnothorax longispinosus TaxID=300112 RepID=A0A4S2KEK1_9HYME|nr:Uncharacterized protein DBV15_06511 [Temnothorax longispinosus]
MKPQKKAVVAKKATKMPTVAKKRRTFTEKTMPDVRKEKKSKKNDKLEDPKRKIDNDKKKLEKAEERKKLDDKKKIEEKKKERLDKLDEKKKQLNKDNEKKSDKIDERKAEKRDDKTSNEEMSQENTDKKKLQKCEEKAKLERQEQIGAENTVELDLKVEAMNGESASGVTSQSDSEGDSDDEYRKGRQKDSRNKERASSPSDERARRMRLFGFWSGPKRHRVASLNALAKVHCLYENETGGVYLGGFCKPKPEKEKEKPKKMKEEKEEQQPRKEKEKKVECKTEENVLKRKLRNVPGLRGKHWDMMESSSSSSSSDEDCEKEKSAEPSKKKMTKRRKRNEEVMDLKDMVVCKRMASLNATAILAASYSDEKNRCGSSSSDSSSSESEVEIIKRRRQNDSDVDKKKSRQGSDPDEVIKPSKKVVIVNQDTDVTITGVYVNQTRSTHHEGFCSIAGMQYRISSTSHTQTAATAVATELHEQQKPEQPCKSYTPLGALSSMQPPGSQGNHPDMSPRRHSAFSAPHQHDHI